MEVVAVVDVARGAAELDGGARQVRQPACLEKELPFAERPHTTQTKLRSQAISTLNVHP